MLRLENFLINFFILIPNIVLLLLEGATAA